MFKIRLLLRGKIKHPIFDVVAIHSSRPRNSKKYKYYLGTFDKINNKY